MRSLTLDAKKVLRGKKFDASKNAERDFARALRKVAKVSGQIVEAHVEGSKLRDPKAMQRALKEYSDLITPWARRQSEKLLAQVQNSNKRAYQNKSKAIGTALTFGVAETEVGQVAQALMNEQVALIKSIPLEAGMRAQKIALESVYAGTRFEVNEDTVNELKKQLNVSTEVAENRAKLIARTETARATASINQARAVAVGAKGYIWRATMDEATRTSHRQMDGKYVDYDRPPRLSDGTKGHAGTFPNCRCYQEPVFDE